MLARRWIDGELTTGLAVSGIVVTTPNVLRLALAAYLSRFGGQSRIHTESDLRGYLNWRESRGVDPLAATRPHIELYVRWLQEVRRYRRPRRLAEQAGVKLPRMHPQMLRHTFVTCKRFGSAGARADRSRGGQSDDEAEPIGPSSSATW